MKTSIRENEKENLVSMEINIFPLTYWLRICICDTLDGYCP